MIITNVHQARYLLRENRQSIKYYRQRNVGKIEHPFISALLRIRKYLIDKLINMNYEFSTIEFFLIDLNNYYEIKSKNKKEVVKMNKLKNVTAFISRETANLKRFRLEISGVIPVNEMLRELNNGISELGFSETYPIGCHRYYDADGTSEIEKLTDFLEQFGVKCVSGRMIYDGGAKLC